MKLDFGKIALIVVVSLGVNACTSMLLGNSGTGSTQVSAQNLQTRVYNRLRESGDFSKVQVVANGSHISLRGQVASAAISERAEAIAGSTAGVTSVSNSLRLSSN